MADKSRWRIELEKWRISSGKPLPLNKAWRLYDDITCVATGLKMAVLLDYVIVDFTLLKELIKLWMPMMNDELLPVIINSDTFILNKTRITASFTAEATPTTSYIDLSYHQPLFKQLPPDVDKTINEHIINRILRGNTDDSPSINYCTVYGKVLGYPIVYYWDTSSGNDVIVQHYCGTAGWDIIQCTVTLHQSTHQQLWQNEHLLYAFSFPCELVNVAKPVVDEWFQKLLQTAGIEADHKLCDMKLAYKTVKSTQINL